MRSAPIIIAVVSWNTRDLLDRCLRSLQPCVESGLADVWVMDNASTDGSPGMVAARHPWAQLVAAGANLGFGAAVNRAAAGTQSEFLLAANADVEATDGALEALLAAARERPDAGAFAPRLLTPGGSTQHSVHPFPTTGLALAFNLGLPRVFPGLGSRLCLEGYWDPERRREVDWAHGAVLLLRREAFEAAGGFDERQWMYAEEIDLQWRLRRAGWTTIYEPGARFRHEVAAATGRAFGEQREPLHIAATYAWLARRRGLAAAWTYGALNSLGAGVRGVALTIPGLVSQRSRARRRSYLTHARLHARGLRGRAALEAGAPAQPGAG